MKTALKLVGVCGVALFGGAVAAILEQQALKRVQVENRMLRQQADDLEVRLQEMASENRRLSELAANLTNTTASQPPSRELLRLRGDVGRLRVMESEVEQSRRAKMQAAQTRLTNAEADLLRLNRLHSEKLVSDAEFTQAEFTIELLKAEAKGDMAEAGRVRLRQAKAELVRATELRHKSLISQAEYDQAVLKVEALRTE